MHMFHNITHFCLFLNDVKCETYLKDVLKRDLYF